MGFRGNAPKNFKNFEILIFPDAWKLLLQHDSNGYRNILYISENPQNSLTFFSFLKEGTVIYVKILGGGGRPSGAPALGALLTIGARPPSDTPALCALLSIGASPAYPRSAHYCL